MVSGALKTKRGSHLREFNLWVLAIPQLTPVDIPCLSVSCAIARSSLWTSQAQNL